MPLRALYLGGSAERGSDSAPGAAAGCTGQTLFSKGDQDGFAYVIGTDSSGSMLSVGTTSKRFGSAIFLAPAAKPVHRLLSTYLDIGGWPRTAVGHGDYYGITTPKGTAILMRPSVVRSDGRAKPYVTLTPAAAALWLKAMHDASAWLWPIPGGTINGKQRIKLLSNLATNTAVGTIFIDSQTGRARLASHNAWHDSGQRIDRAEIQSLALLAIE